MNKAALKIHPFNAVIFGGDGDLSKRKIIPAFFHRWDDGQLNMPFKIQCVSRSKTDEAAFKDELKTFIKKTADKIPAARLNTFLKNVELVNAPKSTPEDYKPLKDSIMANEDWQRIYYLSVPSGAFQAICQALKNSGLTNEKSKVVLEKPLGHDLKSSKEINTTIEEVFNERQIFRIDHYLGKETVQNLMVLRYANHIFERAWNGDNIDHVQITVAESLGVEKRAGYYDHTGALLDMVQNHLLQLLCLVAMEAPSKLDPDTVRTEKLKALESLRLFTKDSIKGNIIRGQYTRGKSQGQKVNSYLEDIEKYNSETETFVAIKAYIDNWRWKDTPFYLRTGKRMKKRYSEIVINFKPVQHNIFPESKHSMSNKLIIRLQPEERIELVQMSKIPGPGGYRFQPVSLKLDIFDSFKKRMPDAYERLIIDILRGNQTLFMRYDELEAAWTWIESINKHWKQNSKLVLYESGSWGPGDEIMEPGAKWEVNLEK
jgi:glucose-6-phosphate 1-dehydrogenase